MSHVILFAVIPELQLTTWAGLAAAAALVGTCWRTIGMWANRIADLVICRAVLKDDAARAIMSQVWMKGRRSPFGLRLFGGTTSFVFPKRRVEVVAYETVSSEPLLFWVGRVPTLISCGFHRGQQTDPSIGNYNDSVSPPVTIRFIRGTMDLDQFVEDSVASYNALRQNQIKGAEAKGPRRFNVIRMHGPGTQGTGTFANGSKGDSPVALTGRNSESFDLVTQIQRNELRLLTWRSDDLVERSTDAAPFACHPVAPEVLSQLGRVDTWLKSEKWFRERGIPWRLGVLLHGAPGGGKDTLIRNLAIRHDLPVYAFDLSTYDNRTFSEDWKQVMQNAPAIALISDIDAVFQGRVNVACQGKQRDGLTFDAFLNVVSGVGSSEGVLLAVTTNRLDALDPALGIPDKTGRSTRPGRIDVAIEVGPMGEAERRRLATLMVGDWPEQVEPLVAAGAGEMAAQFQDRCAQVALALVKERGMPVAA